MLQFLRRVARNLPFFIRAPLRKVYLRLRHRFVPLDSRSIAEGDGKSAGSYRFKLVQEHLIFDDQQKVHDLPAIFHYWSNRWLRPKLESFGFSNPDEFFAHFLALSHADAVVRPARFISLGAGNCDTEVRVARLLRDRGIDDFVLECMDINPHMLERGRELARAAEVDRQVRPVQGDFNTWRSEVSYDAVLANQSLHHVVELEHLFSAINDALLPGGRFITSDMIGRNGHLRWPEALTVVREFWHELPKAYRFNVQLRRRERTFKDWDCSGEGFEGIRAQDILPLLIDRFAFEFFLPYGNVITPFIDRGFGPHFDADAQWDRDFIDRVHARDEAEMLAGILTPTNMMAVMRKHPYAGEPQVWQHLTPQFCVHMPD